MMKARRTATAILGLVLAAPPALAAPSKVMVMQAEGRADGKTRSKVHGAVMKLAKSSGAQISPGDITYSEAAAAVGCKPEAAACKDEVIGMLSVDEIVITTVTPKPGGFDVVVSRVSKGASKDARATVTADKADQLETVAPLFGGAAAVEPKPVVKPEPKPEPPKPEPPKPEPPKPEPPKPEPQQVADPTPPQPEPFVAPQRDDQPKDRSKLFIGGMAGGAALFVVGAVMWSKASGIQSDIDEAPTNTKADLEHIRQLESDGDTYATMGNVLAIGGVIVGGVSTYLFFRNRKARSSLSTATLTPTVFPGGAGLTFTLGATR